MPSSWTPNRSNDNGALHERKGTPPSEGKPLPLKGVRVLEFCHTIMGPSCTLILADLGAEVIKVEPVEGERTRRLKGFGTGYYAFFNRNKRSFGVNLKSKVGKELILDLIDTADVIVENFAPNTMKRLGLDPEELVASHPRLIYCSLKGFLPGPYEHRSALDESVQMMSGLAYMTGPSGRPLRAGASVLDIMGGTFGAIAILVALRERESTGRGQLVQSGLFETAAFLMGQHMSYAAQCEDPIPPMPERVSAWAIYELFDTSDGKQVFIGIVSDAQWERFCATFKRSDLAADEALALNNGRIAQREKLVPIFREIFAAMTLEEALALADEADITYANVARPEDLPHDIHLNATGTLLDTRIAEGVQALLPRLPMLMNNAGFGLRNDPPVTGSDTLSCLMELGYGHRAAELVKDGIVHIAEVKPVAPAAASGAAATTTLGETL